MKPPLIFLLAGEPSGDLLGARIMAGLRAETGGQVRFAGVGGERMQAEGLQSLFPMDDLALFGLAELLPKLPLLLRRLAEATNAILALKPDAVVTIDAPDFCSRVAARVRRRDPSLRLVHCVAPTVWAWRPGRAAKFARLFDHLLALLPFEPPYFERAGLACTYIGHPVVETGAGKGDGPAFRARHQIAAGAKLLAVLPGSRRSEVARLLGDFGAALARLAPRHPDLTAVVPTVPQVAGEVEAAAAGWPVRTIVVRGDAEKYNAFAAADAALAASGTVALELALARVPSVVAYRIHPLTHLLYRRLIRVRFVNLVNLLADRAIVPELLQADCTPGKLAGAVDTMLTDPAMRAKQINDLSDIARWLGEGEVAPSRRAAHTILSVIGAKAPQAGEVLG